jgi:RNA 2',3'-cyclic 3'-phosphodiesterase
MKRCFIAIKIPFENSLSQFYEQLRKELSASVINWVKPENIHLTLNFLGELPDKQIERTIDELNKVALNFESFSCDLNGFGSFGSTKNPTVLFIGINASQKLIELRIQLDEGLKLTGYKPDERIFKPHLTLGRIKEFKNQPELRRLTGKYNDSFFLSFNVSSLILYESRLSSLGPVYTPIRIFPLGK